MNDEEARPQSEAEAATIKLGRGLKTCRTLISGYRSLLLNDRAAAEPVEEQSETPPQS